MSRDEDGAELMVKDVEERSKSNVDASRWPGRRVMSELQRRGLLQTYRLAYSQSFIQCQSAGEGGRERDLSEARALCKNGPKTVMPLRRLRSYPQTHLEVATLRAQRGRLWMYRTRERISDVRVARPHTHP